MKSILPISFPLALSDGKTIQVRNAVLEDASAIKALYVEIYSGHYTLEIINDLNILRVALTSGEYLWLVLEDQGEIVGSVCFDVNVGQRLGKVFAAIVHERYRGNHLTSRLIDHGVRLLMEKHQLIDVMYATTRTVSSAPQKLVERAGFKKLGIFPNVRKIENYETHGLAAIYSERGLAARKKPVMLLPGLVELFDLVSKDCSLGHAVVEDYQQPASASEPHEELEFEVILRAPNFTQHRFEEKKRHGKITMHFFPFHEPNLLLVTKDLSYEVYCHYSQSDLHCAIIGYGGNKKIENYTSFLNGISRTLETMGVRYIELLVGAYKPKTLREVLDARFLPSAYFPAMRLITGREKNPFYKPGERLDYIVFSKSFEVLDFRNVRPEGKNKAYLQYYFKMWKKMYIDDVER